MTHGGARQSGSFLLFRHHNQNSPDPPEAIPPARISASAAVAATVILSSLPSRPPAQAGAQSFSSLCATQGICVFANKLKFYAFIGLAGRFVPPARIQTCPCSKFRHPDRQKC